MDFINKLIKKGIFGLIVCFSFFAFFGGEKIEAAANCDASINDNTQYLVLNTKSKWSDSGVTFNCGGSINANVSVSINGQTAVATTNSGAYVSDSYLLNAGFYKIKYFLSDTTNNPDDFIVRYVRVLPENLNDVRNLWLAEFDKNTVSDDTFNKIVQHKNNYIAIGTFGTDSYLVYFNSLGQYKWHVVYSNVILNDIVANTGDANGNIYFISGKNELGKAFIRNVQVTSNQNGLTEGYGQELSIDDMSFVSDSIFAGNYIYAVGYVNNGDGTKTGKIIRATFSGSVFSDLKMYTNGDKSEYKALLTTQIDSSLHVVAVGATSISSDAGATGGLLTVCTEALTCEVNNSYLWKNSNGASVTTTIFNDIVKQGENYLVVGKSRIDKVNGSGSVNNSGEEDALVVLFNSSYVSLDASLIGSSSLDELYSVKEINQNEYISVGKKADQGVYLSVKISEDKINVEENVITGKNGNIDLKDVLVKKDSDGEINFVFVGSSKAVSIENIIFRNSNLSSSDALFVILDDTEFKNYNDINIKQNALICDTPDGDGKTDGVADSTSCEYGNLMSEYKLVYGDAIKDLLSSQIIDSTVLGTISAYHDFKNTQGVRFILGRDIIVSANPVAPDMQTSLMGIDKWYLYSRTQTIGENVSQKTREELWTTRYMPVENNLIKDESTTYYLIDKTNSFVEDTSEREHTYNNYIKLVDEALNSTVAFQSVEKAKEFALLQEFARVAFVKKKYNYQNTLIASFQNENAALSTQNYYFVYYIDLGITKSGDCKTENGAIQGLCTSYTGYAFASLNRIKEIATLILEKNNYFVSESNNRFNPTGGISSPTTAYFKEEISTEKYMQNNTISLSQNLTLEVSYYAIDDNKFASTPVVTTVSGKNSVLFSETENADYKGEGKYVVRYCYNYGENNQNCGESSSFVIDRSKPIINYNLTNGDKGSITASSSIREPLLIKTSMVVSEIVDIDPYAYTLVNGKKYYLQCNAVVNSANCIENIASFVKKAYSYNEENPNEVFNIVVYDRAGNYVNSYFKIGTVMPKVSIADNPENEFVINVEFYYRNAIDSFDIYYTKTRECGDYCTDGSAIAQAMTNYIKALIYNNDLELKKVEDDPEYIPNIVASKPFLFQRTLTDASGNITSGGVSIPKVDISYDGDGNVVYTLVENENLIFPVSYGLYKFVLADSFYNTSTVYAGIGLGKADLNVYVNANDNAQEDIEEIVRLIPKTKEEVGDIVPGNVLLVKNPSTYAYFDVLPKDLHNDFDENMFFTNKFVYVRFQINNNSFVRISKANTLNSVNGYGLSDETNQKLDCLFKLYGDNLIPENVGECSGGEVIKLSSIAGNGEYQQLLKDEGIYYLTAYDGYYYFAVTKEGTYDIWSEIYAEIEGSDGKEEKWTALPVYYAFTIDSATPIISFKTVCAQNTTCIGEKSNFVDSDFTNPEGAKVNIGSWDLQLNLDEDLLTGGSVNRLMVVSINGELVNAYDFSKKNSDTTNGNYIIFSESGVYTIEFYDAAKNSKTYTFTIDKTPPTIDKIEDVNGKSFTAYQQYVEVEIEVNEGSFLSNVNDKTMLNFRYWVDDMDTQEITVKNENGQCVIFTGTYDSGRCNVSEDNSMSLNLVIPVNRDEATRDVTKVIRTLNISVMDYFGNQKTVSQDFVFDNLNPYLYFVSDYQPITDFGSQVGSEERKNMLSTIANSSLGEFDCDSGINFTLWNDEEEKTIINCNDTPTITGKSNEISVNAYEAYKVSFNNYKKNLNNTYTLIKNGTYLSPTDIVYKENFYGFDSVDVLKENLGKINIYWNFTKVSSTDYVDPNVVYYDANGDNGTSIQDMFTGDYSACQTSSSRKCILYNMYMNDGRFTTNQDFYIYNSSNPSLIATTSTSEENLAAIASIRTIIESNPSVFENYYYGAGTYREDQNQGKYLPALTLEKTCIKVNDNPCVLVEPGRVKLKSYESTSIIYYNIINKMSGETSESVVSITMDDSTVVDALKDNRIWQIAIDSSGKQVKFGFGLASNLGRPIIFAAKDGAGNGSLNYLETVIAIMDSVAPDIKQVSSVSYELSGEGQYEKKLVYYKVYDVELLNCSSSTSSFYYKNENTGEYDSVNCSEMSNDKDYYIGKYEYVLSDDTSEPGEYYKAEKVDLGVNYLTGKDLIVEFDEPIHRIECRYYVYNASADEGYEKYCDINNAEYNYSDDKRIFDLIYTPLAGEEQYFVNYILTVYDFSNNGKMINYLFIDREKPSIELNGDINEDDYREVEYTGNEKSIYDEVYVNGGFKSETTSTDSINTRINSVGNKNIKNTFSYEVKYYLYNYNLTYNNYIFIGDTPQLRANGEEKDSGLKYYVLVKKPTDYVLKGIKYMSNGEAACEQVNNETYCYIEDNYNYYPQLRDDAGYWNEVSDDEYYIKSNAVNVYKIVYRVTDYSGNVSEYLTKTVYYHDVTVPVVTINGQNTSNKYGYHNPPSADNPLVIEFRNEKEATLYSYKCSNGSISCVLPSKIFEEAKAGLERDVYPNTGSYKYSEESIYKVYLHDKGKYIISSISYYDESTASYVVDNAMVLKYNYVDYTFLIDTTSPDLYLEAVNTDEFGNSVDLYYKAHLDKEEYLYCVRSDRNGMDPQFNSQLSECKNLLPIYRSENVVDNDNSLITNKAYDAKNRLIYSQVYKKIPVNAQKYFYNTYYRFVNNEMIAYNIGASYDENNVYIIDAIDLYFREDGKFIIKAQDKAGNVAGRKVSSSNHENDYSMFIIDNMAPIYNKNQNKPTGINYWYSVPNQVINALNKNNVDNLGGKSSYRIFDYNNLNSNFFYAFATKLEAEEFLLKIYSSHINSLADNTCNSGGGFKYSYYNPETKSMIENCFVGQGGIEHKTQALNEMSSIIKGLVYPTYSDGVFFGDSSIKQKACDASVSDDCLNNKDMYKTIYLKVDSTDPNSVTKSIVESCVSDNKNIECIVVSARIVNPTKVNNVSFEMGTENTIDTKGITVYSRNIVGNSSTNTSRYNPQTSVNLISDYYYIFEEVDETLEFDNHFAKGVVRNFNTTYYAIYVDNNEFVDVYYDDGNGISSDSLIVSGVGSVKNNTDRYSLIIRNNGDVNFINKYEIHMVKDGENIIEIYSYLVLKIDGVYHNINDYLVKSGNDYYFEIPVAKEKLTEVELIDRAGNSTVVEVSRSQKAPNINVVYDGSGGEEKATVIIVDNTLTKTVIESVEVLFSATGSNYSSARTTNIRASLVCSPGQANLLYGCSNTGAANGINNYRVVISNKESLYGFFKINLRDNHGNTNTIEFVYNPADMSARYTATKRFMDYSMAPDNIRMINNTQVQLEFNNEINYVILYKLVDDELVEVCNTKSIVEGVCLPTGNSENKVVRTIDDNRQYVKSTLYYVDEGIYQAKIFNRASEIINRACFEDDGSGNLVVSDKCKGIESPSSLSCSWNNNPDICDDYLEVISKDVVEIYDNVEYLNIEIDKTMPVIDVSDFVVSLPTGNVAFEDGKDYTNAEVTINWGEPFVRLSYTCVFVDEADVGKVCSGNDTGFKSSKSYTFAVSRQSKTYMFWFEDFAGNTTENHKYTFTVNVVLPDIALYEVDETGVIIEEGKLEYGEKGEIPITNKNVQLLCYVEGKNDNRCSTYDVKLEKANGNGSYSQMVLNDITRVSQAYGNHVEYRYTVSVKKQDNTIYSELNTTIVFTIDKQSPVITVSGDNNNIWGIYKGEVSVKVSDGGIGTVYSGCIDTDGNKNYVCDVIPFATFESRYSIKKTGVYMIVARDEIGNVTIGDEIKYIRIDNDAPTISVTAKGQYLDYVVSEKGFTNSEIVLVEASDNNESCYFKYRIKDINDVYGEWNYTVGIGGVSTSYLEFSEEGFYEVVPIDAVGNEGMVKHFIIYRQSPKYNVSITDNEKTYSSNIINGRFNISWEEPMYSYQAPIIKVMVNGKPYKKSTVMSENGEYLFEFIDLAGNTSTYKIAINTNDKICLDNASIVPKAQTWLKLEEGNKSVVAVDNYKFSDDDIIILATSINYLGIGSACGVDILSYKMVEYVSVDGFAKYANANKGLPLNLSSKIVDIMQGETNVYVTAIIIDREVAKNELGIVIGENFFTKDPLGWSLIFIAGLGAMYFAVKLVFFRKKVRVLK